eukprot:GHVS01074598.1.p1 GENE.GHVS01074598.1~~GHVS01074598.1.p1  ORF type:complete len:319 (-),score=52.75 GHVS01074598.1:1056-2012(-)
MMSLPPSHLSTVTCPYRASSHSPSPSSSFRSMPPVSVTVSSSAPLNSRPSLPSSLLAAYMQALGKNPLFTKCITAAVINGCSDLLTQSIKRIKIMHSHQHRRRRNSQKQQEQQVGGPSPSKGSSSSSTYRTPPSSPSSSSSRSVCPSPPPQVSSLPPFHLQWSSCARQALIGFLMRAPLAHSWFGFVEYLFKKWESTKSSTVVTKVVLDQVLYGPLVTLLNFVVVGIAEGRSFSSICRTELKGAKFFRVIKKNALLWTFVGMYQYKYVPNHLRVLVANIVSLFWMAYIISVISKQSTAATHVNRPSNENTRTIGEKHL